MAETGDFYMAVDTCLWSRVLHLQVYEAAVRRNGRLVVGQSDAIRADELCVDRGGQPASIRSCHAPSRDICSAGSSQSASSEPTEPRRGRSSKSVMLTALRAAELRLA